MIIRILGSAAGGGVPQWNCNGRNSVAARRGGEGVVARTQSSLAVSGDGERWVLLNASPDLRQQILAAPALHPAANGPARASPIDAVVLTNADVDHIAGLLTLREGHTFTIYATPRVLSTLSASAVFDVLDPGIVRRIAIAPGRRIEIGGAESSSRLQIEAFGVPGKVPLYLESKVRPDDGARDGDTIGLEVRSGERSFFYIPACARIDGELLLRLRGAELLFFDGTLFDDDEMIAQGLSQKTGARMGHIAMSGANGSLAGLAGLGIERRIYIHINTSNPVLRDGSPERALVAQAGWRIAHDGMEIVL